MERPFQHLYDRCDQLDVTLKTSELNIINAAYPEKVERWFKEMKKGIVDRKSFEEAPDLRDKEKEVSKLKDSSI